MNKAALFEIEALAFLPTKRELSEALASGEYAEALIEIIEANALDTPTTATNNESAETTGHNPLDTAPPSKPLRATIEEELAACQGADPDALFHELRIEHTHLFVGAPKPAVSPFAGVWFAEEQGVEPLLFVNKESMDVERFYRSCGVGQPEGTNEPLDHIGSELEFLQYLCLLRAGAATPPEGITIPEDAYERFYLKHFISFAHKFAAATIKESRIPFFRTVAQVLAALPEEPF
jgi:TorA maturation chaperone TorD